MNISFSSLMKQLKKLLKQQKKRWISLAAIVLVATASVSATAIYLHNGVTTGGQEDLAVWLSAEQAALSHEIHSPEAGGNQNRAIIDTIQDSSQPFDVYYEKNFVCGEELEHIGLLTPMEIKQFSEQYPQASIRLNEQQLYFTETVNDLSRQCKENAYFGLDKDGNLSLFEGLPSEEQIIRTFFQLNVQHLKSSLPRETLNQLYEGIRIMDVEDYNSVISTFSYYAVQGGKLE